MESAYPCRWGKYILLEPMASGGMADLFLALQDLDHSRLIAIKRIRAAYSQDEAWLRMFKNEALALLSVRSPYVVQTYDVNLNSGEPYIVLEYIEGLSLKKIFDELYKVRQESISEEVVVEVAIQIVKALKAAHECQNSVTGEATPIIHRDISPQNIILSISGYAKLIDFGVAKADAFDSMTQVGEVKGNLTYMSPEQFLGDKSIDPRSDLFSLGVLLWELLTGKKLFANQNIDSELIMEKFIRGSFIVEAPVHVKTSLNMGLSGVVAKLLAKNKEDRFSSATEVLRILKHFQLQMKYRGGPEFLYDFLNENFSDQLTEIKRKSRLLIDKAKSAKNLADHRDEKEFATQVTFRKLPKRPMRYAKYFAALIVFALVGAYFLKKSEGIPVAETASPQGRSPANVNGQGGGGALLQRVLTDSDRKDLREFFEWAKKLRGSKSESLVNAWDTYSDMTKKLENPFEYAQKFGNLSKEDRAKLLQNLKKFSSSFDAEKTESGKIEIIKKYSSDLKLLPPPRRDANQAHPEE